MAEIAISPTPLPHGYRELSHRPSRSALSRTQLTRPNLKRGSPLANGYMTDHGRHNSLGDSSDDEAPIPVLSAAAEELLGVRTGERPTAGNILGYTGRAKHFTGSPQVKEVYAVPRILPRTQQPKSPPASNAASPRIVKVTSARPVSGSLRRAVSIAGINDGSPLAIRGQSDMKTPGSRQKSYISGSTTSPHDVGRYSGGVASSGSDLIGTTTVHRNKGEEALVQGSVRVKRLGKMSGSFLSGPARRGMIRRQSEEDQIHQGATEYQTQDDDNGEWVQKSIKQSPVQRQQALMFDDEERQKQRFHTDREEARPKPMISPLASRDTVVERSTMNKGEEQSLIPDRPTLVSSLSKYSPPVFKPTQVPTLSPRLDQENIPPPTFKRDKAVHEILSLQDKPRLADMIHKNQVTTSPSRRPLMAKTNNTPLRPAPPPPPKMTMLETATAPAASSAANSKRKPRNMISVNGKHFTRMECVGRGGSGRVYRVMAENFKLFAVKSVSLEGLDDLTIRGFKGEIDLLRKLQDVDRVVRLYDYEINEEKKVLRVLMDIAELDLKKILDPKMDEETGKLDITFTRYIWKEMLECVSAVHACDIVHSDLKPANFVMMQGRLKLIDFGIANAIQDDTLNVYREQQVGTPNYMSPEAIVDTNSHNGKRASGAGKLMKLGRPSDVWSLGCILYQIVYGKTPFAHITNQLRKVMAIIDPNHAISYPSVGIGGTLVPTGLIRTLRKCLDRDIERRATIQDLLSEGDSFLYPDAAGTVPVSVELIRRLQHNIIQHVVAHGVPSEEELKIWPKKFFESIRAAVEEGRA